MFLLKTVVKSQQAPILRIIIEVLTIITIVSVIQGLNKSDMSLDKILNRFFEAHTPLLLRLLPDTCQIKHKRVLERYIPVFLVSPGDASVAGFELCL